MAWRVFRLIARNQGEWTLGALFKDAKALRKKKGFDPAVAELSPAAQKEEYLKQFTGMKIEGITVSDIPTYIKLLRKRLKGYLNLKMTLFIRIMPEGKSRDIRLNSGYSVRIMNQGMLLIHQPIQKANQRRMEIRPPKISLFIIIL
jgi:hypothetical protein